MKKKCKNKTISSLITNKVPLVNLEEKVEDVLQHISLDIKKYLSINYVYIVNKKMKLLGVISIKELFNADKKKKIKDVMIKKFVFAAEDDNQEKVSMLSLKNNIKQVPVLDKNNIFLGAILNDNIVDIIYEEFQEDISKMAGLKPRRNKQDKLPSAFSSFKRRLPWLLMGLLGGLLAAKLISSFEYTLSQNIVLAAFIPLIVYIASAVQNQSSVFIIRDLAFNKKLKFNIYGLKELAIISMLGFVISVVIFFLSLVFYSDLYISFVLAISLFLAILSSIITGVIIPFVFSRFKYDPADASGPIATIIQDIFSIGIYLLIAQSLL